MISLVVFTTLLLTQVTILVGNQFSLGSKSSVPLLVLISVFGYLFLCMKQVVVGDVWRRMSRESKSLFIMLSVLVVAYLILFLFRRLTGEGRISITLTSLTALGVLVFIVCDLRKISINFILNGCIAFISCVHIYLTHYIANGGTVRTSALLTNINVYNSTALFLYPLIICRYVLFYNKNQKWRNLVLSINIIAIPLVVVYSGSRFSIWGIVLGALICIIRLVKDRKLSAGARNSLMLSMVVGIFVMAVVGSVMPELKNDANRSLFLAPSGYEIKETVKSSEKSVKMITRPWLYKESLIAIKAHPLVGTGSSLVFIEGWGMHPSHNYFMEAFLAYGMIFGFLYMAILFLPVFHFIKNANRSPYIFASLISFASLFLFAMVEPILTDQILVVMVVWLVFGAMNNKLYEIDGGVAK